MNTAWKPRGKHQLSLDCWGQHQLSHDCCGQHQLSLDCWNQQQLSLECWGQHYRGTRSAGVEMMKENNVQIFGNYIVLHTRRHFPPCLSPHPSPPSLSPPLPPSNSPNPSSPSLAPHPSLPPPLPLPSDIVKTKNINPFISRLDKYFNYINYQQRNMCQNDNMTCMYFSFSFLYRAAAKPSFPRAAGGSS